MTGRIIPANTCGETGILELVKVIFHNPLFHLQRSGHNADISLIAFSPEEMHKNTSRILVQTIVMLGTYMHSKRGILFF